MTGHVVTPRLGMDPCRPSCPHGDCANCVRFDLQVAEDPAQRPGIVVLDGSKVKGEGRCALFVARPAQARAHLPVAPAEPAQQQVAARPPRKRKPKARPERKRTAALTLKDIRDRSEEVGDCWLWTLNCNSAGYPMVSYEGTSHLVRRLAYVLQWNARGMVGPLPTGLRHNVVADCGEKRCCNPACLRLVPRGEVVRLSYVNTRRVDLEYGKRCAARVRQGTTKVAGLEQARAIRADSRTAPVVAAELGVSVSLVQKIRQGKIWREAANNASVFGWRPAA